MDFMQPGDNVEVEMVIKKSLTINREQYIKLLSDYGIDNPEEIPEDTKLSLADDLEEEAWYISSDTSSIKINQ